MAIPTDEPQAAPARSKAPDPRADTTKLGDTGKPRPQSMKQPPSSTRIPDIVSSPALSPANGD
jgi:hypothetical protein